MSTIANSSGDLIKQIREAFQLEQQDVRKATTRDDIPRSYELIDPEWFTHIVCKSHPGARVVSYRPEIPDELDRGHMRVWLTYNDAGRAAGLPASVFCKDSQKLSMRLFNSQCGLIMGEVAFYNRIRALVDIETPRCLLATYDPRSFNSILVFDDLLLEGAEFCTLDTPITRARIESQLAYLARLHSRFYERLDQYPLLAGWRTFSDVFRRADEFLDMKDLTGIGFQMSESVIPPRLFARHADIWSLTQQSVNLHRSRPNTLTHSDAHLRNWYVTADDDMRVGDWQLYAVNDLCFDLAYSMSTSLTVENRRAWEGELLKFYIDRLQEAGGPRIAFDEVWENYRKHLFTALAWWTPCAKPPSDGFQMQPMDDTFEMIKRVATAIDDLDSVRSFN